MARSATGSTPRPPACTWPASGGCRPGFRRGLRRSRATGSLAPAAADMYVAGVVGMKAGVPQETPAFGVNRLGGIGVGAIVSAAQGIQSGDVAVALAGGAEPMSRGPYWMPDVRWD